MSHLISLLSVSPDLTDNVYVLRAWVELATLGLQVQFYLTAAPRVRYIVYIQRNIIYQIIYYTCNAMALDI